MMWWNVIPEPPVVIIGRLTGVPISVVRLLARQFGTENLVDFPWFTSRSRRHEFSKTMTKITNPAFPEFTDS